MRRVRKTATTAAPAQESPPVPQGAAAGDIRFVDVDTFTARYAFMFYGDNGSGKTTIGATAPNPLIVTFSTENRGIVSARGVKAKAVMISTWGELESLYWYLAKQEKPQFESLVFDTVTAMQNICMTRLLTLESIKSKCPEPGDLTLDVFPAYATQRHYGMLASSMMDMLLRFHELPYHLVLLAQKKDVEDEHGRILETVPAMSPGVAQSACNIPNVIGYCYKKQGDGKDAKPGWFVYLAPHDRFKTKNQGSILPATVQNFSVRDAITLIEKSGKGR